MIAACKQAGKSLSIGYRLHFEPYNLEMVRLGTKKVYGDIKKITAGFGFLIGDPTQWRLKKRWPGRANAGSWYLLCAGNLLYNRS
jgi:predicted dehydrogenase